jgi:hypothetical protein
MVDSFFDIWTEVSLDGGQTWQPSTSEPAHMRFTGPASSDNLPPREGMYVSPADWQGVYDPGVTIMDASSMSFSASFPPPAGGKSDTETFGSTIKMMIRTCPTCPYQEVSASAQLTVQVNSRAGGPVGSNGHGP